MNIFIGVVIFIIIARFFSGGTGSYSRFGKGGNNGRTYSKKRSGKYNNRYTGKYTGKYYNKH